jgi:hypothetical protein
MHTSVALALLFASPALVSGFVAPCTTPAGCIAQVRGASAVRPASVGQYAEKKGGLFGGIFGGDKKDSNEDVEDAIEDWKEIGFDIDEVIKAEEDSKKKDQK